MRPLLSPLAWDTLEHPFTKGKEIIPQFLAAATFKVTIHENKNIQTLVMK